MEAARRPRRRSWRPSTQTTVISVGAGNTYGHPKASTLAALSAAGVSVYRTDLQGTIVATATEESVSFSLTPSGEGPSGTTTTTGTTGDVRITAIDKVAEVVTVKNFDSKAIDMSGWRLVSVTGSQTFTFPSGFVLVADATVQVRSGPDAYGNGTTDLMWTTANQWNNSSSDPGELYDSAGSKVTSY